MDYTIKKHWRAKAVRITVYPDGRVGVTVPYRLPNFLAQRFVESKREWIEEQLAKYEKVNKEDSKNGVSMRKSASERRKEYEAKKEIALEVIGKRVAELNALYNFKYRNIAIRNQKTRWGSCSRTGNLNFNYKIAFLEQDMLDYVIIHELCHLKEFNHSPCFWALVAHACPDHKRIQARMKKLGAVLS